MKKKQEMVKYCLSIYGWSRVAIRKYSNMNYYYSENKFINLELIRLNKTSMAKDIILVIKKMLYDYDIETEKEVFSIMCDGASVIKKVCFELKIGPQLCLALALHLALIKTFYKPKKNVINTESICTPEK